MTTQHHLPTAAAGGRICISLALPDTESTLAAVPRIEEPVDVVEIRLDTMAEANIATLCTRIDYPLLFTNRPVWEGGMFQGMEDERLEPLMEAVRNNAALIDLELKAAISYRDKLLAAIKGSATRMIISYHDFKRTPDAATLDEVLQRQVHSGAHIGKIVTMAREYDDVLNVLSLQSKAKEHGFPLIAFCMGEAGTLSRVFTLLLGGFMSYGAIDEQQATAPGQLSVRSMRAALKMLAGLRGAA
jgi:3-dehydroquinate dehydratase-1/3-dehydroquinate dehydratase/shikimate dehydrogenase